MTLLDAPKYDDSKARLQRNVMFGVAGLVVLAILFTLSGYLACGHGWAFTNLPAEHRVGDFFAALQAKDYNKAFGIYNNDADWQQHPQKYASYPEKRFEDDWSTQDPIGGPLTSYHVDISRTDGSKDSGGTIVAVTVNGRKKVFMNVIRKDGTLSWPAYHELQY